MITEQQAGDDAKSVAESNQQSMRRTGYALLLTTMLTGVLGIVYWYVAARTFPAAAVGRAASLVAATSLLSGVGTLVVSGAVMRFLPKAGARSRALVLRAYGAAAAISALLTAGVLVLVWRFAPAHSALRLPVVDAVLLGVGVVISTAFVLEDNVLTGVRAAVPWVPVENGVYGLSKLALLLAVAPAASYGAIYLSWILPILVIVPVMNTLIFRRLLPAADTSVRSGPVKPETRRAILRFVRGDASGGVFAVVWVFSLPLVVTAELGPVVNARFYVAFLLCTSLDLVTANLTSALVVQGAYAPRDRARLVRATLRRALVIVVPLVAFLVAAAPVVLKVYGPSYVAATGALRVMLLASLPRAVVTVFYALCRLHNRTRLSAVLQGVSGATILAGAATTARHGGLVDVAVVLLVVQTALACLCLPAVVREARSS